MVFLGPHLPENNFVVNVNVEAGQLLEEMTLKSFVQQMESQMETTFEDYGKLDEYDTTISGQPAIVITYTAKIEASGITVMLKDMVAYFVKDNVACAITYDVPAEVHDEYADSFELVISTFEFE